MTPGMEGLPVGGGGETGIAAIFAGGTGVAFGAAVASELDGRFFERLALAGVTCFLL